jgi:hypothetical protein
MLSSNISNMSNDTPNSNTDNVLSTNSSNSIVLANIISEESSEWKDTIQSFIQTKTDEFKTVMKANIEKIISDKISNFYNRDFDHDNILFDVPFDSGNIDKCIGVINTHITQNNSNLVFKSNSLANIELLNQSKKLKSKCFTLNPVYESPCNQRRNIYVFKKFMIVQTINSWQNTSNDFYEFLNHSFPTDMLFALKHFQIKNDYGSVPGLLKFYSDHPEYFKTNCSEFESICKKEYELIQKQKEELKLLIEENTSKVDYYKELEQQIESIEIVKSGLKEELDKIKMEKDCLSIVKQKLSIMQSDIDKERKELEEEKNKLRTENFDIDKYLNN